EQELLRARQPEAVALAVRACEARGLAGAGVAPDGPGVAVGDRPGARRAQHGVTRADRARVAARRDLERVPVLALAPGRALREPRREPRVAAQRGGVLGVRAADLAGGDLEREEVADLDHVAIRRGRWDLRGRRAPLLGSALALDRRDALPVRARLRAGRAVCRLLRAPSATGHSQCEHESEDRGDVANHGRSCNRLLGGRTTLERDEAEVRMTPKVEKSEQEWRGELTPEQYEVLRRQGTEPPFTGRYVYSKDSGTYRCAGCDAELFSSDTKFESGTGWPSFYEPVDEGGVELREDRSHGMARTEAVCG